MRWEPPASARIVGFLLSLCAGLALGRADHVPFSIKIPLRHFRYC